MVEIGGTEWRESKAEWIIKTRSIEGAAKNPYRPRGQIRYGAWRTLASFPADQAVQAEARWRTEKQRQGLADVAIFRMGKRFTDSY